MWRWWQLRKWGSRRHTRLPTHYEVDVLASLHPAITIKKERQSCSWRITYEEVYYFVLVTVFLKLNIWFYVGTVNNDLARTILYLWMFVRASCRNYERLIFTGRQLVRRYLPVACHVFPAYAYCIWGKASRQVNMQVLNNNEYYRKQRRVFHFWAQVIVENYECLLVEWFQRIKIIGNKSVSTL